MNRVDYQYEPLSNPRPPRERRRSQFKAGWNSTIDQLERELAHLGVSRCVIQVDADRREFRLDGMLRADARLRSPAVAVSFHSKGRDLTFPCDTYDDWRDNMRAIALALEALRAVDRYGVTSTGEQYSGWAALPPPSDRPFPSRNEALGFLRRILGGRIDILPLVEALREAEKLTHPDRGGNVDDFKLVQHARKLLQP